MANLSQGVADQTQPVHMQVLFCESLLIGAYPFNLCFSFPALTFAMWCKAVWCKSFLMEAVSGERILVYKDSSVEAFWSKS